MPIHATIENFNTHQAILAERKCIADTLETFIKYLDFNSKRDLVGKMIMHNWPELVTLFGGMNNLTNVRAIVLPVDMTKQYTGEKYTVYINKCIDILNIYADVINTIDNMIYIRRFSSDLIMSRLSDKFIVYNTVDQVQVLPEGVIKKLKQTYYYKVDYLADHKWMYSFGQYDRVKRKWVIDGLQVDQFERELKLRMISWTRTYDR